DLRGIPKMADYEHPVLEKLCRAITARRRELGLSQEFVATKSELCRSYYSDIEKARRNPSLVALARIAHALQVPLWRLVAAAELEDGQCTDLNSTLEVTAP